MAAKKIVRLLCTIVRTLSYVYKFTVHCIIVVTSCIVKFTLYIAYSWKYWQCLNLAVWPQVKVKKYWQNLNLAVAPRSILPYHEHLHVCYLGVLLSFRLKCLNKAGSSQIYKKYKCQNADAELAICTAHVEGLGAGPRVLLHALHHYTLRAKIIAADFNLAVSTPTTKLPNLILHQIFQLYNNTCVYSYLKQ